MKKQNEINETNENMNCMKIAEKHLILILNLFCKNPIKKKLCNHLITIYFFYLRKINHLQHLRGTAFSIANWETENQNDNCLIRKRMLFRLLY